MSIKVMSWVWENGPPAQVDRLVLLALADFCDDTGWCWPSMDTIGSKACMTGRGARNVVRRLEVNGWLEVTVGGGRGGCSRYRVVMQKAEADTRNEIPGNTNPERDDHKPGTSRHKTRNVDAETRNQRSAEPFITTIEPSGTVKDSEREFEAVWPSYPRRVGKGAAAKEWAKARKSATFEQIAKPLSEFCRAVQGGEQRFIPHMATWLHQRRWEDEQGHASNRPRTSTEDIANLSRLSPKGDLDALFAAAVPHLRIAK